MSPFLPSRVFPGNLEKSSQIDLPRPSTSMEPSIWKAATVTVVQSYGQQYRFNGPRFSDEPVANPQRKPFGRDLVESIFAKESHVRPQCSPSPSFKPMTVTLPELFPRHLSGKPVSATPKQESSETLTRDRSVRRIYFRCFSCPAICCTYATTPFLASACKPSPRGRRRNRPWCRHLCERR
jgi:hypothetical protein